MRWLEALALALVATFLIPRFLAPAVARAGEPATEATGDPARAAAEEAARARQARELDELQRRDLAEALSRLGVEVRFDQQPLRVLGDWKARIEAARALANELGVEVDWRTTPLRQIQNLRLRAAKAARLARDHGITVDWRRYSWRQLDALLRRAIRVGPRAAPHDGDDLLAPGTAPPDALRLQGRARPPVPRDPDAIIEPSFAYALPTAARSGRFSADPDAILAPTFAPSRPPPAGEDDVIDPWSPRLRR